jgi:RimJ/RimL family protein N-acetyltransferase
MRRCATIDGVTADDDLRPTLRTERIELRPMTTEHLDLLVELDADPEVLRHILGRARTRDEVHEFWGPRCADTEAGLVGLGWWVGFDRVDDGSFLGWWDLSPTLPLAEPGVAPDRAEVGYRLARRHWRRGLATEGAEALLAHGFDTIGLDVVWAETMAVNAGSRGVMRRLGMRHVRTEHREWTNPTPGADEGEVVYEITSDEWHRRTPALANA